MAEIGKLIQPESEAENAIPHFSEIEEIKVPTEGKIEEEQEPKVNDICKQFWDAMEISNIEKVSAIIAIESKFATEERKGETPLGFACICGYHKLVQYFVEDLHVDKNCAGGKSSPPLVLACERGYTVVLLYLLSIGANPNIKGRKQRTPLHACVIGDKLETATQLLAFSAETCPDINLRDQAGLTPFHYACINGNIDMINFLIEHKASVNSRTSTGQRPIHFAARQGNTSIVQVLLDCNVSVDIPDYTLFTPVVWAAEAGQQATVKLLLERGANPLTTGWNGNGALHFAALRGHRSVVQYLISLEKDVGANFLNMYLHFPRNLTHSAMTKDTENRTVQRFPPSPDKESIIAATSTEASINQLIEAAGGKESQAVKVLNAKKYCQKFSKLNSAIGAQNVWLLTSKTVRSAGKFLSFDECKEKRVLVAASKMKPGKMVLFVAASFVNDFDDQDIRYFQLVSYLESVKYVEHYDYDYVWIACSCLPKLNNEGNEAEKQEWRNIHLNICTALMMSNTCLIIPDSKPLPSSEESGYTTISTFKSVPTDPLFTLYWYISILADRKIVVAFLCGRFSLFKTLPKLENEICSLGFQKTAQQVMSEAKNSFTTIKAALLPVERVRYKQQQLENEKIKVAKKLEEEKKLGDEQKGEDEVAQKSQKPDKASLKGTAVTAPPKTISEEHDKEREGNKHELMRMGTSDSCASTSSHNNMELDADKRIMVTVESTFHCLDEDLVMDVWGVTEPLRMVVTLVDFGVRSCNLESECLLSKAANLSMGVEDIENIKSLKEMWDTLDIVPDFESRQLILSLMVMGSNFTIQPWVEHTDLEASIRASLSARAFLTEQNHMDVAVEKLNSQALCLSTINDSEQSTICSLS